MFLLQLFGVLVLFLLGIRLSAFFSGSETGFYRVSIPRLNIDAQAGDRVSERILWFARNPACFVATTLIGNNLANYVTTLAISLGVVMVARNASDVWEVVATVLLSPVVYLFGELLPKNLYYRAPLSLLRRDSTLFRLFYWLFLPASWPLVSVTQYLERHSPQTGRRTELVFGRSRLVQLLRQGRREGVLTEVQNLLANGVLQTAPQRVVESMTPSDRVLGLDEAASREDLLEFARRYGTAHVAIRRAGTDDGWFAYVRVIDITLDARPVSRLFRALPTLAPADGKLDALQKLHEAGETFGVVTEGDDVLGIVSSRGLSEQLFRPAMAVGSVPSRAPRV